MALSPTLSGCASEDERGLNEIILEQMGDAAVAQSPTATSPTAASALPTPAAGAPPSSSGAAATPPASTATQPPSAAPGPSGSPTPTSDPFGASPTCTSGTEWTRGHQGSSKMTPGQACIDCHSRTDEAPAYTIAGTVYPSGHEPDDCNGSSGSAGSPTIVITGADGVTFEIPVNSVGNFYYQGRVALPYMTKIRSRTNEIPMTDPATSGDCNSCHTQAGSSNAPGRIVPPP